MFLQHIADVGLLPHDPNSNVLADWPPVLKRRICGDVLRSLGSHEGASALLRNEAHVQWAMEVTGEALRLPLEFAEDGDSLEKAVGLYAAWLGDETALPAVAGAVRPAFLRDAVRHCSLIFERRRIDPSPLLRRRYLEQCQRVMQALEAFGRRGSVGALCPETWRMLLRVILGIADAALAEGHAGQQPLPVADEQTAQLVSSQLLGELLHAVFVIFLSCPVAVNVGRSEDVAGDAIDLEEDCWKLLRERFRSRLDSCISLVPSWTAVCWALSDHLVQLLGGDAQSDNLVVLRWKDNSASRVKLRNVDVVTSWYRSAVLLGRPAAIREPAVRRSYLKDIALLSDLWSNGAAKRIGVCCWLSLVQPWLLEAATDETPGLEAERMLALITLCDVSTAAEPCITSDEISVLCACLQDALLRTPITANQPHSDQEALLHLLLISGTALAAKTPGHTLHLITHLVRVAFKVLLVTCDVTLRGAATNVLQTLALLLCQPSGTSKPLLNGEETATLVLQSLTREAWQTVPSGEAWNIRRFSWLSSVAALLHGGPDVICDTAEQLLALVSPSASDACDQAPDVVATAVDALALLGSGLAQHCATERAVLLCGVRLVRVFTKLCTSAHVQLSRPSLQSCAHATSVLHCALDCTLAAPWLLQHTAFPRALLGLIRCARQLPAEFPSREAASMDSSHRSDKPSTMEPQPQSVRSSLSQLMLGPTTFPLSASPSSPQPAEGLDLQGDRAILSCTRNIADYVWHVFSEHAGLFGKEASQGAGAGVMEADLFAAGGTGISALRCFVLQDPDAVNQISGIISVLDDRGSVVLIIRRASGKFVWRFRAITASTAPAAAAAVASSAASSAPTPLAARTPAAPPVDGNLPRPKRRETFSEVFHRVSGRPAGERAGDVAPSVEEVAVQESADRFAEAFAVHGGRPVQATAPSSRAASDEVPSIDHALLQQLGALGGGLERWLPLRSGSVGLLNALRELDEVAPTRLHFQIGVLMASRWPSQKTLAEFEGFLDELGAPVARRALAGWKADMRQQPLLWRHAPAVTLIHSSYYAETLFVVPATMPADADFDEVLWLERYAETRSVVLMLSTSDCRAPAMERAETLARGGALVLLVVALAAQGQGQGQGFHQVFCLAAGAAELIGPALSGAVLPSAAVSARLVRLTALRALLGGGSSRCDPLLVRQQRLAHIGRAFATGQSTAEVQASFVLRPS